MTEDELRKYYFDWLTSIVFESPIDRDHYLSLLWYLHKREFTFTIFLDENRYYDGKDMKNKFLYEHNLDKSNIYLLGNSCSVLEMMVALASRCENSIMRDYAYGDRTPMWFAIMINNLGLMNQQDPFFDIVYTSEMIDRFLYRKYDYYGSNGGLFYVENPDKDMRETEIWCQLMWFLYEWSNKGENEDERFY